MNIRVGISSCLLGQEVRFDGGHKRDTFLIYGLGPYVEWVPVCPEAESGMGTPREPMHLKQAGKSIQLLTIKSGKDLTQQLSRFTVAKLKALEKLSLSGFVLKKGSPSCGMERVKVYPEKSPMPKRDGRGLFAEALMAKFPLLPVEEEGRLSDPGLRENFVERIFAYNRFREFDQQRFSLRAAVEFHTHHKYQIMAHSQKHYKQLGQWVAGAKGKEPRAWKDTYGKFFMEALSLKATPAKNANVLMHLTGYFKKELDRADKEELHTTMEDYRKGLVPLVVPLTLIKHYIRKYDVSYLKGQSYLEPHPKELMLRNHI